MPVTLIFTVLNEADSLPSFLKSLLHLDRKPDEIVACDGGSTDNTFEILQEFARTYPVPFKVIQKPGDRGRGRNAAIHHAAHEIIACTDAGSEVLPNWLSELMKPIEGHPDVAVVAGFYTSSGETLFQRCAGAILLDRKLNPKGFLPSARSVAFRKEAWAAVGGFPENLGSAEDTAFDLRLKRAGFRFAFAPDAIVRWRPRRNSRELYRQYFEYSFWDARSGSNPGRYLRIYARYLLWFLVLGSLFIVHRSSFSGVLPSPFSLLPSPFVRSLVIGISLVFPYWAIWSVLGWRAGHDWRALFIAPFIKFVHDLGSMIGFARGLLVSRSSLFGPFGFGDSRNLQSSIFNLQSSIVRTPLAARPSPKVLMLSLSNFNYLTPALNEGRTLAEQGYDVELWTLRNGNECRFERLAHGFHVRRFDLITRRLPKRPFFWALKYAEFVIRVFIRGIRQPVAVCVAHNLDALLPSYFIAHLRHRRLVYRAHELWTEVAGTPMSSFWRRIERYLLKQVDRTIVPNEERARIVQDEYRSPRTPLVVRNCPRYVRPVESRTLHRFLAEQGVHDRKIALFQGRLGPDRCTRELVTAARYLNDRAVLILLGPTTPEYRKEILELISQLGLSSRVFVHDPVPYDQVFSLTASADLGIVLYRNQDRNNFYCAPNKLFEYFMAGLPIVASNFPGLRRLVHDAATGLLVDPENPLEIATAINSILFDTGLANRMKRNSLSCARVYNWERESRKLIALYGELT